MGGFGNEGGDTHPWYSETDYRVGELERGREAISNDVQKLYGLNSNLEIKVEGLENVRNSQGGFLHNLSERMGRMELLMGGLEQRFQLTEMHPQITETQVQKLLETQQQEIFRTMATTFALELPKLKEDILRTVVDISQNLLEGGETIKRPMRKFSSWR
jgi:hypothetical protein